LAFPKKPIPQTSSDVFTDTKPVSELPKPTPVGGSGGSSKKQQSVYPKPEPVWPGTDGPVSDSAGTPADPNYKAPTPVSSTNTRDSVLYKETAKITGFSGTPGQQQTVSKPPDTFPLDLKKRTPSELRPDKPPKSFYERTMAGLVKASDTTAQRKYRQQAKSGGQRGFVVSPQTQDDITAFLASIQTREQVAQKAKAGATAAATAAGLAAITPITGGAALPVFAAATVVTSKPTVEQTQEAFMGTRGMERKQQTADIATDTAAILGGFAVGGAVGSKIPGAWKEFKHDRKMSMFEKKRDTGPLEMEQAQVIKTTFKQKTPGTLELTKFQEAQMRLGPKPRQPPKLGDIKKPEIPITVQTKDGPIITTPKAYLDATSAPKKPQLVSVSRPRLTARRDPLAPPKDTQAKLIKPSGISEFSPPPKQPPPFGGYLTYKKTVLPKGTGKKLKQAAQKVLPTIPEGPLFVSAVPLPTTPKPPTKVPFPKIRTVKQEAPKVSEIPRSVELPRIRPTPTIQSSPPKSQTSVDLDIKSLTSVDIKQPQAQRQPAIPVPFTENIQNIRTKSVQEQERDQV